MPDETVLRTKAREAIRTGRMPSRRPDRTWGGPGVGLVCTVCGEAVTKDQLEMQVEFSSSPPPGTGHISYPRPLLRSMGIRAQKRRPSQLARPVMNDLFRTFLHGVSARGGYCLDCLSEMYGEPARLSPDT